MEVLFDDERVATLCRSSKRLADAFGLTGARMIGCRLHEIEAAASLAELRLLPHLRLVEVPNVPRGVRIDVARPLHMLLRQPGGRSTRRRIDWHATGPIALIDIRSSGT